jgi:hypothetical protein
MSAFRINMLHKKVKKEEPKKEEPKKEAENAVKMEVIALICVPVIALAIMMQSLIVDSTVTVIYSIVDLFTNVSLVIFYGIIMTVVILLAMGAFSVYIELLEQTIEHIPTNENYTIVNKLHSFYRYL